MIASPRQLDTAIDVLAERTGISRAEFFDRFGKDPVQFYRKVAFFMCREHGGWSYPALAEWFGREHSTVYSAVRMIKKDPDAVAFASRIWKEAVLQTEVTVEAFPRQERE